MFRFYYNLNTRFLRLYEKHITCNATLLLFDKDFLFSCQRIGFQDVLWKLFSQRPCSCSFATFQSVIAQLSSFQSLLVVIFSIALLGGGLIRPGDPWNSIGLTRAIDRIVALSRKTAKRKKRASEVPQVTMVSEPVQPEETQGV
jgi:hypothetical protein